MPIDPLVLKRLFQQAITMADRQERSAWLVQQCGDNAELLARLQALLAARDDPDTFLERLAPFREEKTGEFTPNQESSQSIPLSSTEEKAGHVVGRYKLLEKIGEGGMGSVWMAEQREPVKRLVAIKLIRAGMDTQAVLTRFEAERQALALMDHSNIAKVLDGGTTESRRPFFVMELVKGLPLTEYCDSRRLSVDARLQLFIQICSAVQHAHQKGIIHRDLKPSNVLVTENDGNPIPKVIDFGLAKALTSSNLLTDRTLHTAFGTVVGTPLYMAPEQVGINALDTDTRSDVYALGVLLYELLTGTTPLEKKRFKEAAWEEVKRVIQEEEPIRPSMRLSTSDALPNLAAQRHTEPAKLTSIVRGELDWIVMKALEKDRNRRYETANGFAMDLQRYLANEAVSACPPSAGYRLRKFVSRNKGKVLAASIILAALLLGILGTTWGMMQARAERDEKELARQETEESFQRTRQVVDDFFTLVSQNTIFNVPGLQPVRKELLEKARVYYQETLEKRPDDPYILAGYAATCLRLSLVYFEVAQVDDLTLALKQGVDFAEQLFDRFPSASNAHLKLAGVWNGLRSMQISAPAPKDHELTSKVLLKFVTVWKRYLATYPDHPLFQRDLAVGQLFLSTLHNSLTWGSGDTQGAITAKAWLESSIPMLEKLVETNPRNQTNREFLAFALGTYAESLVHLKRNDEAIRYREKRDRLLAKLAEDFPDSANYREYIIAAKTRLTNQLMKSGKYVDAEKACLETMQLLDDLHKDHPGTTQYGLKKLGLVASLSQIHQHLNKPDNVDIQLQQLLVTCRHRYKTWPDQPTMLIELVNVLRYVIDRAQNAQRLKEVEPFLLECRNLLEQDHLKEMHDVILHRVFFYLWQTRVYYESVGRTQDRDAICRKAMDLSEKLIERYAKQPNWLQWECLGQSQYHLKMYQEALATFTRTLELKQDVFGLWQMRGDVYYHLKQYDKAISDYTRALELDSQNTWTLRMRGWCYKLLGQYEKSAADYRRAIELNPQNSQFRNELGEVLNNLANAKPTSENKNQREQYLLATRKELLSHADKSPNNATAQEQLGSFLLWQLRPFYETAGRRKESEEACKEALAIFEKLTRNDAPENWLYWLRLGESQIMSGKGKDALFALNRATELKPDDSGPWHWRGDVHGSVKQHDKAIQDYSKAIAIDANHAWTWRNRAWNYTMIGQWDKAIADYLKATSLMPDNAQFRSELVAALLKLGKTDEALSTFQKVMEQHPQDHQVAHQLGVALLNAGRKVEAQAAFRRTVDLLDTMVTIKPEMRDFLGHNLRYLAFCLDAKTQLREQEQLICKAVVQFQMVSKNAESSSKSSYKMYEGDTYRMLGDTLQWQKRQQDAEAAYRQAISCYDAVHSESLLESNPDAAWRRSAIDATFKPLLQLLSSSNKQSEATKVCEEAIRLFEKWSTERPVEKYFKVALEKWRKDLENLTTITSLQQAVAQDPENPVKLRNLGIHYDKQANLPEALAAFQKVIELEPAKALNHNNLGIILLKLKKPQEAIVAFRKAIEIDPKYTPAHHALAETLMNAKDQAGAIATFRKVEELDPKNAEAMNNLAWLLLTADDVKLRNVQEALTLSRKAIELTKDDWVNLDTHSLAAYRNGQWKESLEGREKMIKLRDPRTEDKFFLAMCLWKLDRKEDAKKQYAEAASEFAKIAKPDTWLAEINKEAETLFGTSTPPAQTVK